MKLHGAAMMVMLFMIGRISSTHVMRGLAGPDRLQPL